MFSLPSLAKFRYAATLFLALPLVAGAVAAPTTEDPPAAKAARPAKKTEAAIVQAGKPVALVAVATATPAAPADPQLVQLRGLVVNPDGRPCAGASVYPAGAPRQLVVTDAQGAFALPVPAGGAVSLRVEYFGEGSSRVEVPTPGTGLVRVVLGQ